MFDYSSHIYVAGHSGLLGSAIVRKLKSEGYQNIITRTHAELDLTDKVELEGFFKKQKIEYIFLCAGKVGGIIGNKTSPATYLHQNLAIQDNMFELACKYDVKNLLFYGSSCTYPKVCEQPMKEEYWLTGALEETSIGYAGAKIAGIVACKTYNTEHNNRRFICVVPNSMYGENDNFDLENSHVFSALIRKFDDAKERGDSSITLWGSGTPRREFIYSGDVAEASIFLMQNADVLKNEHYNLGTGVDYSIQELAEAIAKVVGFKGEIIWDASKPDGAKRKLLDSSKFLRLGWKPKTSFEEGLKLTYKWYKDNYDKS